MGRYILIRNAIVESGYADDLKVSQVNDLASYLCEMLVMEGLTVEPMNSLLDTGANPYRYKTDTGP